MGERIFDDEDEITDEAVMKDAGTRIIKSLGQYIYQTSKHLSVNTGLSIGTVIDYIDGNGDEIYGEQVGNIWVYYLPKNHPARRTPPIKLYFGGPDGRMICFREAEARGNTGNRKVGDTFVFERQSSSVEEGKGRRRAEPLPDIDLEELEELASINPNQKSIADALDVGHSQLVVWIRDRPEIRKAYERGAAKHKKAEAKPEEKLKEKTKMEQPTKSNEPKTSGASAPSPPAGAKGEISRAELRKRLTAEYFEQAAKTGKSTAKIAVEMGMSKEAGGVIDGILYDKGHPELNQAWKRGKAMRQESTPTVKPTIRKEKVQEKTATTNFVIPEKAAAEAKPPIELPPSDDFNDTLTSDSTSGFTSEAVPVAEKTEPKRPEDFLDHRQNSSENPPPSNWKIVPETELAADAETEPEENQSLELRREKIEEVQEKLMPKARSYGGEVEFLGTIMSRRPAGLQVSFDGDFFALSEKQRRLMCEMAALNDEFKQQD